MFDAAPNFIELDDCRSYATRENLIKGLEKLGLTDYRPTICRNAEGRWTAIFSFHYAHTVKGQCYVGFASQHGFMTLN